MMLNCPCSEEMTASLATSWGLRTKCRTRAGFRMTKRNCPLSGAWNRQAQKTQLMA
ncbi:MAG: hypothetical protein LBQ79_08945 [Deltaproteobacteria bacterium]|jgi:hypothetical protein|nr:hypothetical protein [Deltaproteobacteria bacterium]